MKNINYNISEEAISIGERIRKERKKHGLTQNSLSEYLGISVSYLGSIERGNRSLSAVMIKKIHDYFDLSYDYILDGKSILDLQYSESIKEDSIYGTEQKITVLLNTCTPEELMACYEMIKTFLVHIRREVNSQNESNDSELSNENSNNDVTNNKTINNISTEDKPI